MLIRNRSTIALFLLISTVAAAANPPGTAKAPSPEAIAILIQQLGVADFRIREQASAKLEEFGAPILPELRKAAAAKIDLEVKRRIESVVLRIEDALLKVEEKRWEDLDAPRRGIKDRIVKILAKTPALSDEQATAAIYLLTVGRRPTDEEAKRAKKQFAGTDGRAASVLQFTRSLAQGEEFCAAAAAANVRLLKLKKDLGPEKDLAKILHRLNGAETQKMNSEIAASLNKAVKADEPFADLTFLLVVSRFPRESEAKTVLDHLRRTDRQTAAENVIWALVNTREFAFAE